MPISIQRWKCSVCGAAFENEKEAADCERGHIDIVGIEKQKYSLRCPVPSHITVLGSDGKTYRYGLAVM